MSRISFPGGITGGGGGGGGGATPDDWTPELLVNGVAADLGTNPDVWGRGYVANGWFHGEGRITPDSDADFGVDGEAAFFLVLPYAVSTAGTDLLRDCGRLLVIEGTPAAATGGFELFFTGGPGLQAGFPGLPATWIVADNPDFGQWKVGSPVDFTAAGDAGFFRFTIDYEIAAT